MAHRVIYLYEQLKNKVMNNTKNKIQNAVKQIRVRLDKRTIITLKDLSKLEFWKEKYPNLQVIPV